VTIRVVAIVLLGMAANIFTPLAPSLLGAMVDYQGLSIEMAGRLVSFNFWGGALASVLALFVLHRPGWNLRLTMLGCLLIVIATNLASISWSNSYPVLVAVRLLNGVGAGLGFTVACVAVIATQRIERSYAVLYGSPFLISGFGLALLPLVYRAAGIDGAFYAMAAVNLIAVILLPWFPRTIASGGQSPEQAETGATSAPGALTGLMLLALLLYYAFNSGVWAYFERMGVAAGMTPERVGAILGPGMAAAIVGMVAASLLGDRLGYRKPIYVGVAAITIATLAFLGSPSELLFGIAAAVFNASIPFVTPYMVAILALLVPSGMGVTAANIVTITGFAAGPLLISYLVSDGGFTPAILATAVGFVVVWILLALFMRGLRRQDGFERLKANCLD
jgi:predicted MFS family arabinose efflux permease